MNADLDIYSFSNSRKLLQAYYAALKAKFPKRISYRYLAQQAGFASSNFLHLVIMNRRNLSLESTQRLARMMRLTERERKFFEQLVRFTQTTDADDQERALRKMISFREYRAARRLTTQHYSYFSKWYLPVVRELVNLATFREDPTWIATTLRPSISPAEAAGALDALIAMGFLVRDTGGRLQQAEPNLATDPDIAMAALFSFHRTMIEYGKRSLMRPASEREISALTLSLSPRTFALVRNKLRTLQNEIQDLLQSTAQDEPADTVCQLNFQLFNLTQSQRSPA